MSTRVLVVYYSLHGHVEALAGAVAAVAESLRNTEIRVRRRQAVAFALVAFTLLPLALWAQSVEQGIQLFDAKKYVEAREVLLVHGQGDASAAFYLGRIEMENGHRFITGVRTRRPSRWTTSRLSACCAAVFWC